LLQSMVGGKIVVFQAVMPNIGPGALTSREDPKIFDTPKVRRRLRAFRRRGGCDRLG